MKCQNLWDTFLEKKESFAPTCTYTSSSLLHKEGRKPCESARLSALARPHRQPFFAQAQYFFSLDSRSAEMQGAVAALLARIVTAAIVMRRRRASLPSLLNIEN